jgi:hypothetical protein
MEKYVYATNESFLITHVLLGSNILSYITDNEENSVLDKIESTIIGLYLADFASALLHLFFDNYRGNNSLFLNVSDDFKRHHINPQNILDRTIKDLLFQASVTPFALLAFIFRPKSKKHKLTQLVFLYAFHFGQLIHKAAHYINHASKEEKESAIGQILQILQKYNIILSPEDHKKHHSVKYNDVNFGLINAWSNPLVNEIIKIPFIHKFIFTHTDK